MTDLNTSLSLALDKLTANIDRMKARLTEYEALAKAHEARADALEKVIRGEMNLCEACKGDRGVDCRINCFFGDISNPQRGKPNLFEAKGVQL